MMDHSDASEIRASNHSASAFQNLLLGAEREASERFSSIRNEANAAFAEPKHKTMHAGQHTARTRFDSERWCGIIIFVVSEAHPCREREINMLTAGKCGQLPAPIYQIVSIVYWPGSKRDVFYCRDARIISNTWRLVFLLRFDRSMAKQTCLCGKYTLRGWNSQTPAAICPMQI